MQRGPNGGKYLSLDRGSNRHLVKEILEHGVRGDGEYVSTSP